MNKNLFFLCFLLSLGACETNDKSCNDEYAFYNEDTNRCECKDGFEKGTEDCECPEDYILIDGECLKDYSKVERVWDVHEQCDQAGEFNYEIEIKESSILDVLEVNNLFEVDQDIDCLINSDGSGCDFIGGPEINGFPLEGGMLWNNDFTEIMVDYTIKGTVEENCSAVLTPKL